ncbi:MAG TPA: ROK family protein [Rhizomicrobium sp.]|jgi:fructokinase
MRLGVDLGGTKTEIIALDESGHERLRRRIATVRDYAGTIAAIGELVAGAERELGETGTVGVAIPGNVSCHTGLIKNANSLWLNGKPFPRDLEVALDRPVRLANDANCFALSEATDGAGAGQSVVFGVILGTGCGGGVVIGGKVLEGAHGIGGEWGHNPLPGMTVGEWGETPVCYCGQQGCIEQWLAGPAFAADFHRHAGGAYADWTAEKIVSSEMPEATAALQRWTERLARALASVVNIIDPDVIVLGGGLSNIGGIYDDLPGLVERRAFTPETPSRVVKNVHGDSSGVRGAAWLWQA